MNIIQAKHINSSGELTGKAYTYELPDGVRIRSGKYIAVENKRTGGSDIVKTVTDSEDVNDNILKMIMGGKKVQSMAIGEYFEVPFKIAGEVSKDE